MQETTSACLLLNNICSLNDRLAYELLYDNNIIFYANNKDDSISAMLQNQRMSEISSRFVSARITNSYVRQIHFFSFVNDYVISSGGSNYISSFFDKACYDYYKQTASMIVSRRNFGSFAGFYNI